MAIKTILGKTNESELKRVQGILINQMERLNDDETMKSYSKREMARSGALSQQASAYVKSVQTQIKVLELSGKYNVEPDDMNAFLGIKILNKTEIAKSELEQKLDKFNAEREK